MSVNSIAVAAALLAMAQPALATDLPAFGDIVFSPNAGTLGLGIEASTRLDPYWAVRAGVNGGAVSYLYRAKKSDLHSDIMLLNAGLTADYYPFAGSFHLSGGVRLSANQVKGRVKNLQDRVRMGNRTLTVIVEDPLTRYTATQNAIQPYLGTGYSLAVHDRVTVNFDLGALYAGQPDLDVTSHAERYGFTRRQINREIERAQDRIAPFRFYPVVQIGLNVKF